MDSWADMKGPVSAFEFVDLLIKHNKLSKQIDRTVSGKIVRYQSKPSLEGRERLKIDVSLKYAPRKPLWRTLLGLLMGFHKQDANFD